MLLHLVGVRFDENLSAVTTLREWVDIMRDFARTKDFSWWAMLPVSDQGVIVTETLAAMNSLGAFLQDAHRLRLSRTVPSRPLEGYCTVRELRLLAQRHYLDAPVSVSVPV